MKINKIIIIVNKNKYSKFIKFKLIEYFSLK